MIDERTEQLINRRLDGELHEGEALELDKALIRSPEAHELDDDLRGVDALAGATLRSLFAEPPASSQPVHRVLTTSRNWHRVAQYGLGAVAAILFMVAGFPLLPRTHDVTAGGNSSMGTYPYVTSSARTAPSILVSNKNAEPSDLAGVVVGPRQYQKQIDRDVIGVVDPETQSVYLLELQTARNRVRSMRANY